MPARNPVEALMNRQGRLNHPVGRQDGKWFTLFKEWNLLPAATQAVSTDNDFDLVGTGTVDVAPTFLASSASYGGGITISTRNSSAADDDYAGIFPLATSRWGQAIQPTTGNAMRLTVPVRTPAAITTRAILTGWKLTDTPVLATDANQAYFLYDTDATTPAGSTANWVCVNSVANTDTVTDSGVAVAASTDYELRIEIPSDLKTRFYINNALVHTATTAFTTASVNLKPFWYVVARNDTPAATTASLRFMRLSHFVA